MINRMKELITLLNEASKAYFANDTELISNYEYDKLYDELVALEEQMGIVLANSPTVTVGYESVDELPKEAHENPMLSLGKTKEREELVHWLQGMEGLLSWKLDGLTVVLTYENGMLTKAITRGNGEVGEVITNNAKMFVNLPISIPFKESLTIRGEAVIRYSDFQKINDELGDDEEKYKNPRNLCSGSVRQLDNQITAKRLVHFFAFQLVNSINIDIENSREKQLLFLKEQGFDVVDYRKVTAETIIHEIEKFEKEISAFDVPSDGLVLIYNDIAYGQSLGRTAKFPRDSIAFKWMDELKETTLLDIEWSPSRTGLINPVAIFEPVELEGTTVSRASVHNVSVVRNLQLGIGDKIMVYKANMIIPQIAENITKSDNVKVLQNCPACGQQTKIEQINDVQSLYCINPNCSAKKIKSFTLFVSRNALNIDGLSEATLEKFISKGFIHEFADIFHLNQYKDEIVDMEGFGLKSYNNLMQSIESARNTTLPKVIYALGIENIGLATSKIICNTFQNNIDLIKTANIDRLSQIDGIGEVIATTFATYMSNPKNQDILQNLLKELVIENQCVEEDKKLEGKVFVITGTLEHFDNRNELKERIEQLGGKVTGSVTKKTDALINNDVNSQSSKNKKARELDVRVLTEEEFLQHYL